MRVPFIWALGLLLGPVPAWANTSNLELWGTTECQIRLAPETHLTMGWEDLMPNRLRIYTEQLFADDLGLEQALLSVGPIWDVLPGFSVALQGSSVSLQPASNKFNQEARLELEPSFTGDFTPVLHWAQRHRLEYRLRADRQAWVYRTRLGLLYQIPDTPWTPFVSNEVQIELGGAGLNQNRALLGVRYQVSPRLQLSAAYLHRLVLSEGSWIPEQGLFVNLFYAATDDGIFQLGAL